MKQLELFEEDSDDEDKHMDCPSWPNCDVVPAGCKYINDALRNINES